MPGFLGGSTSGGGTGGEIQFPKEFVDPVTKLRISQPETLIDTDFEYGLQPTKWETLELINNTPSFFSKSGDTTIPGIVSITTNAGTREITVTTALDHGLAVGIPINVQGTKSVTADGSFIINSIPDTKTFTYLCKDNQAETLSIEDLYTSIVTGEFFQGAQLRISDSEGIVTDNAAVSELTVKTESAHGFGVNTPFYFLNLNSTVAQEFEATNTAAKSFDSSNSATAQTFDGSNTLSQIQIDFSNSATLGGTASEIVSTDAGADTITVTHTTETFVGSQIGTPLYYDVVTSAGYFANNPRGVVFLKTTNQLASGTSIFQVSEIPDGDAIDIEAAMTGTFQLANQARIFAGNNVNTETQAVIDIVRDNPIEFEAANDQSIGGNGDCTVTSYSGSLVNVSVSAGAGLDYYQGAMVLYSTTGSTASGLTNNTTYFVDSFFTTGTDTYAFTLKNLPTDESALSISGGTGTQTFSRIGISLDKDIVHIKDSFYDNKDMLEYEYPENGAFESDSEQNFYFVSTAYDQHNYKLNSVSESFIAATGGNVVQTIQDSNDRNYTVHRFTSDGTFTLNVTDAGTFSQDLKFTVVGSGSSFGGETSDGTREAAVENITVVVANGGRVDVAYPQDGETNDIEFSTINPVPMQATGGSITEGTIDGVNYRVHTFTSVGTSTFSVSTLGNFSNGEVYYVVVGGGGGGGGGDVASGGGAGGFRTNFPGATSGRNSSAEAAMTVTATNYTVTVGNGGAGGSSSSANASNGGSSTFNGITSTGGGGGAGWSRGTGNNGGSGAGATANGTPGSGIAGQGFGGGTGLGGSNYTQGGGGGAGQVGENAPSQSRAGNGGNGLPNPFGSVNSLGQLSNGIYYLAGGGGGGVERNATVGNGGLGGGGRAGRQDPSLSPVSGTANTGGGGGGTDPGTGGSGGSGVVIIGYPISPSGGN